MLNPDIYQAVKISSFCESLSPPIAVIEEGPPGDSSPIAICLRPECQTGNSREDNKLLHLYEDSICSKCPAKPQLGPFVERTYLQIPLVGLRVNAIVCHRQIGMDTSCTTHLKPISP